MPRLNLALYVFAFTFLLTLITIPARSQLILQTPEELGIDITHLEEILKQQPSGEASSPPFEMTGPFDDAPSTTGPKLTECLTVERKLSLFYEYVREVAPVMKRIMSPTKMTTLLVPVNQAIIALPHKPHQDAVDSIEVTEVKAKSNAERFVMAHTLSTTIPWPIDASKPVTYSSMLGPDHRITFRRDGDEVRVDPGNVKVLAMKEASNGRIVFLDGTLQY